MLTARLAIVAACLAVLWLPATAIAADPVVVAGVATDPGGAPASAVEVVVMVAGTDGARAATTDAAGAFSVEVGADLGDTIHIRATGPTISSEPDGAGCIANRSTTGDASLTIESVPLEPVVVTLDQAIESRVCAATAPPDGTHRAEPTPPATDGTADGDEATPGGRPYLVVAGLAFVLAGVAMLAAWRSKSAGR